MGMKVKVKKQRRVKLTRKAYAYPGLAASKVQPFAMVGLPLLVVGLLLAFAHGTTLYYGTGLIAWLCLSWGIGWQASTRADRATIRKTGRKSRVMVNNFPEIKALVSEHCRSVGVKEPDTYVLDEDAGRITVLGGGKPILVLSSNMREVLSPEEFQCALVRAIAEIRTGAVGLKSFVAFGTDLSSVLRPCLFPLYLVAVLLRQTWLLLADVTTDRLMLITTRKPRLCLSTVMHLEIERNPLAQIDHADVEAFLRQGSGMQATTAGVSTHFKMGTGLQTVPNLQERIQELIAYSGSSQYKELCAKIDEAMR